MNFKELIVLLILPISTGLLAQPNENIKIFTLISYGDVAQIDRLISQRTLDFNYQLTDADVRGRDSTAYEPGMTPILYALSLERLTIAKRLLSTEGLIDANLVNGYGVSALHMLIMTEVGDRRYMPNGDQHFMLSCWYPKFGPFNPVVDPMELKEIFELLVKNGFNRWDNFKTTGQETDQNLITEALVHGKTSLIELIAQHGGPMPDESQRLSFRQFLMRSNTAKECFEDYQTLATFLNNHDCSRLFKILVSPVYVKELAARFAPDESLAELLRFLTSESEFNARDYEGFLEGAGSSLPENIKTILRQDR